MSCTLDGIVLPDDTLWTDELTGDWSPVVESVDRDITGSLIVEPFTLSAGRPVTLAVHWLTRETLSALSATLTAGRELTLLLPDSRVLAVGWRYDVSPIAADELLPTAPTDPSDWFDVILHLRTV
ncbi:hypothetical protein [Plasticicumulans acidivorans]|uniref:Uncharacterized protein n=1 Tax=Plasticicumulans acidivorans TaxID=886464 RepID=A0A317N0J4_9GAMM|nr:hypothetical protein [Plasticicumulans acidivorans]PWV65997.1 hypothetical protein C7443_101485 [Plasticicumulans acidivorans]